MIEETNCFYQERFGFKIEKSSLNFVEKNGWGEFCKKRQLEQSSEGVYLPRNFSAYAKKDSEYFLQNLFHEFFGHGLYVEHSTNGQKIHELEQKLVEEEKEKFNGKTLAELKKFRENSLAFLDLKEFTEKVKEEYEGFAIWTEYYLSFLTKTFDSFSERFEKLSEEEKSTVLKFTNYSENFGDYGLFYSLDFPKYYDLKKAGQIIKKICGKKIDDADLVLLYGSKKPKSDIDFFVVLDKTENIYLGWADVFSVKKQEFNELVSNLDIAITDPLFSGEFLFGDKDYFEEMKKKALNQEIDDSIIKHNLKCAETQKNLAIQFSEDSRERRTGLKYHASYSKNAEELKKGKKALTLKNLLQTLQKPIIKKNESVVVQ